MQTKDLHTFLNSPYQGNPEHSVRMLRIGEAKPILIEAMHSRTSIEQTCKRLCDELHTLARALARMELSHEEFLRAVLRIERELVTPFGFSLIGTNTLDDWTHFSLRFDGTGQICAAFEFLPETGEFRKEYRCGDFEET